MIKKIIETILLLIVAPIVLACLISACMWVFDEFCDFVIIPTIEFVSHLFGI